MNKTINHKALEASNIRNRELKIERVLKYNKVPKCCKECGSALSYEKRINMFCSKNCSASYNNKNRAPMTEEQKIKISKTLTIEPFNKICPYCKNNFLTKKKHAKYCSRICLTKGTWNKEGHREKMSEILSQRAKSRHENNDDNFGWQKRDNIAPSYPESIAIRFFKEKSISYIREYKFKRYFLDFLLEGKVVIEIDGRQHEKEERKLSDSIKDKLLIEEGYKVFRIKYPSQNIREELSKILIENNTSSISST